MQNQIYRIPASGFDPRTAKPSELKLYGIPQRPNPLAHPILAARWDRLAALPLTWIEPRIGAAGPFRRRIADPVLTTPPTTSNVWSGAAVSRPAPPPGLPDTSEPFNTISATWNVPDVAPPVWAKKQSGGYVDGTYLCGVWIGIDGTSGSGDVFQAGTASAVTVSGSVVTSKSFSAWFEWYGDPSKSIDNFPVSPGDEIECTLCAPSDQNGAAFFVNKTTLQATNVPLTPPAGTRLQGNVAEWIVEDPQQADGTLYPFPNYTTVEFASCLAGTKNREFDLTTAQIIVLLKGAMAVSIADIEDDTTLKCVAAYTSSWFGNFREKKVGS